MLLELTPKPKETLGEEMDISFPFNFAAVASLLQPLPWIFFPFSLSLLLEVLCQQVMGTGGSSTACEPAAFTQHLLIGSSPC